MSEQEKKKREIRNALPGLREKLDTAAPERRKRPFPSDRREGFGRRVVNHGPGYPGRQLEEHHASGRELREAQDDPDPGACRDHPGYVKGAEVAITELWRDFNKLMGWVQAEVDHFTQHSGDTDVLKGVKRIKADPPGSGHLEAVPAKCDNCLFYFVRPDKERQGSCQVSAPKLEGWPMVWDHDWCGEHQADRQKV